MPEPVISRLLRTLGALALALLNATLLLIVFALFFAWQLSGTLENAATILSRTAAEQGAHLSELQTEVAGLRDDISDMRDDIETLPGSGALAGAAGAAIAARLDTFDRRVEAASAQIGPALRAVAADPGIVIDRAVVAGVAEAGRWLAMMRGCTAPPQG